MSLFPSTTRIPKKNISHPECEPVTQDSASSRKIVLVSDRPFFYTCAA